MIWKRFPRVWPFVITEGPPHKVTRSFDVFCIESVDTLLGTQSCYLVIWEIRYHDVHMTSLLWIWSLISTQFKSDTLWTIALSFALLIQTNLPFTGDDFLTDWEWIHIIYIYIYITDVPFSRNYVVKLVQLLGLYSLSQNKRMFIWVDNWLDWSLPVSLMDVIGLCTQQEFIVSSPAYSISQEICTRFCCALLCCGYAIVHNEFTWSIYPYSSGLLCWQWGNR